MDAEIDKLFKDWSDLKASPEERAIRYQVEAEIRELYNDWFYSTASPEERAILYQAVEFEDEYFGDLTLSDSNDELTSTFTKMKKDDDWVRERSSTLEELGITLSEHWRFLVRDLEDSVMGACRFHERCILIDYESVNNHHVLLHEMIHAYEGFLETRLPIYRQFLTIVLYEKLRGRNSNLLAVVRNSVHVLSAERTGFVHSPLFLLKSLDLDDRLGLPWGTIHGYGQRDVIDALQVMK